MTDSQLPGSCARRDSHPETEALWPFWRRQFGIHRPWPGEDVFGALYAQFVGHIRLEDPTGFAAMEGRPRLYLANHQVAIESILFSIAISSISKSLVGAIAKEDHKHSWLGELMQAVFSHPGVTMPNVFHYRDEYDAGSLLKLLVEIEDAMRGGQSLLVHTKAARVLTCREPLTILSSVFTDLAIKLDVPIVPVRITGGVPVAPMDNFREFPIGFTRQDYQLGTAISPAEVRSQLGPARTRLVLARINGLAPTPADETPNAEDRSFHERVVHWMSTRGTTQVKAVILTAMERAALVSPMSRGFVSALGATQMSLPDTAEGRWFANFVGWVTERQLRVRLTP